MAGGRELDAADPGAGAAGGLTAPRRSEFCDVVRFVGDVATSVQISPGVAGIPGSGVKLRAAVTIRDPLATAVTLRHGVANVPRVAFVTDGDTATLPQSVHPDRPPPSSPGSRHVARRPAGRTRADRAGRLCWPARCCSRGAAPASAAPRNPTDGELAGAQCTAGRRPPPRWAASPRWSPSRRGRARARRRAGRGRRHRLPGRRGGAGRRAGGRRPRRRRAAGRRRRRRRGAGAASPPSPATAT